MQPFNVVIALVLVFTPVTTAQQRTNASDCDFAYNQRCAILAHQPFPSQYVCSKQGVLHRPNQNLVPGTPCGTYDAFASDTNQFGTGNSCGIGCFNNAKCITWSWDFDNSECRWYTKSLQQMDFRPTPNGPYTIRYFHRGCLYQNCTSPNLVADGSFETGLPLPDDGSNKPDTWFYSDTPGPGPGSAGQAPATCNATSQSFIGATGYHCHQGSQTHAIFQYPSRIRPNTTYSIALRFGYVPMDEIYGGEQGYVFACQLYGDGVLLRTYKYCLQDFEPTVCGGGFDFSGYSPGLRVPRWKSGPGPAGSHSILFNCTVSFSRKWDTWIDDVEIRAV